MAKQKMSTKKKVSAVTAGALAVALAVGGAYAWTDYSQDALNTFKGTVAADVLLHDDFDGENKDVYVENTGDNAVFVRVKFAEYLQVGNNSVLESPALITDASNNKGLDVDGDGAIDPEYLDKTKAQPGNILTWPVHAFADAAVENKCGSSTHTYFKWNMSGAQKKYLAGVTEASANGYGGLSQERFDNLTDGQEFTLGDITTKKMETAAASSVMMLADWLKADPKPTDACWLLDTDGWAYWSAALYPDTATNLLLDEVLRAEDVAPSDNWVYNIDVQLQAATANELDYWYADGIAGTNDVPAVASADNSIATATANGLAFIKYRAGDAISSADGTVMGVDGTRYISVANNIYGVAILNVDGTAYEADPGQPLTLAGNDGIVGNDDDNMLAGRGADDNGGAVKVNVASIDKDAMTYKIEDSNGVLNDYLVTAGIDKKLGTFDDVLTAPNGGLGKYDVDGAADTDTETNENIGWNYLGGPIDNMLVTTEYVLDNVTFNGSGGSEYYSGSKLEAEMLELYTAFTTNDTDFGTKVKAASALDMAFYPANTVYVCTNTKHSPTDHTDTGCTYAYAAYYINPSTDTTDFTSTSPFFALSIKEIQDAYGDTNSAADLANRRAQGAPAYLHATDNTGGGGKNYNNVTYKDGDGNQIATTHYWLRSPGYTTSRAARVTSTGDITATATVTTASVGARPACYLTLGS